MKIEGIEHKDEDIRDSLGYSKDRRSLPEIERDTIEEIMKLLEIPEEEVDQIDHISIIGAWSFFNVPNRSVDQ